MNNEWMRNFTPHKEEKGRNYSAIQVIALIDLRELNL
jgi:hypothetical protein